MARILLLHQYFPPDIAVTGRQGQVIASALAAGGHDVSAIVAQPSYDADARSAPRSERYEGVDVHRVSMGPFRGRRSRALRFAGYATYLTGAVWAAVRRAPDVIITFHIPPFLPGLAIVVGKLRGSRIVYIPQDIHPDILLDSGWLTLPGPVLRLWNAFNRAVLSRSDVVVALGDGMRETLIAKGARPERTIVIPVWAEPSFPVLARDDDWRDNHLVERSALVVLYAGNMGLMHPLEEIFAAAAALADLPIRVVVAGDGVRREHWERLVAARGLDRVLMLPFQHGEDFRRLVAAADVTLVTLTPGMERLAVPSKPYPFLAAGRPLIAMTSPRADIAVAIEAAGAGWHVADADALVALLKRLAGDAGVVAQAAQSARALYEADYTRERAAARYGAVVSELIPR